MILGGFQGLTLIDFPGRLAALVFTQGCNLRCGYCHNRQLIAFRGSDNEDVPTSEHVLNLLSTRRRLLEGVVVSGGEPTLQPGLLAFLGRIKDLGLLVKLDTNGTNPSVLGEALRGGLVDYVAMDVKHDPHRYLELTGVAVPVTQLAASRNAIATAGVDYEFRTTVLPRFHDDAAIEQIARFCKGAPRYVLQAFRPAGAWNAEFRNYLAPSIEWLQRLKRVAEPWVGRVDLVGVDGMLMAQDAKPESGIRPVAESSRRARQPSVPK